MKRQRLAFIGIGIFLLGIGLGSTLFVTGQRALLKDQKMSFTFYPTGSFEIGGVVIQNWYDGQSFDPNCGHVIPLIDLPTRVMTINHSQILTVNFSNNTSADCPITVLLDAPDFDIGAVGATQTVTVPPGSKTAEVVWVLSPKKPGTFQIVVRTGLEIAVAGVTVLNELGLSPLAAQVISFVASIFGPILTVPWWVEKWKERKAKKKPGKKRDEK